MNAATKEYAKLQLLSTLWADDAQWQANVTSSVGSSGYTLATNGDDGDAIVAQLCEQELTAVSDIAVYDFMGSEDEEERFYLKEISVFKHNTTGEYWVEVNEDIWTC